MRKTEERAVSGFDRVLLRDWGEVIITQAEVESLQVEADEELLSRIQTEVSDGRLIIGIKGDWLDKITTGLSQISYGSIRFNLQVKQLKGLEVMGAGKVHSSSLDVPDLAVRLGGAGSVEIGGLKTGGLKVELPGAGKIELEGTADTQEVHLSGAGSYQGLRLVTKRAKVNVSGVGSAAVNVQEELDAHISGVGGVQYKGEPKLQTSISGLGRLTKV